MNRERQQYWTLVAKRPIPMDGSTVLVWLEKKLLRSKLATACYHPNIQFIGNVFAFDAPTPLYWRDAPLPPPGEFEVEHVQLCLEETK